MTTEPRPSTSSMKGRVIAVVAQIKASVAKAVQHFTLRYDEPNVSYDQPRITYEFHSYRGEMDPHPIKSPSMKGR